MAAISGRRIPLSGLSRLAINATFDVEMREKRELLRPPSVVSATVRRMATPAPAAVIVAAHRRTLHLGAVIELVRLPRTLVSRRGVRRSRAAPGGRSTVLTARLGAVAEPSPILAAAPCCTRRTRAWTLSPRADSSRAGAVRSAGAPAGLRSGSRCCRSPASVPVISPVRRSRAACFDREPPRSCRPRRAPGLRAVCDVPPVDR